LRTAFVKTLCQAADFDPSVWLLTADLGYSVLEPFMERFPDRFVNVGVAEQNMIGVAAGLALSGKTVVVYSIVNFVTLRCFEQIRNDVCYQRANVKIVGVGAGYTYGAQGYTHHGIEDLSVIATLPEIDVIAPGDPLEARLATRAMLARPGPCYLRLGKAGEPPLHSDEPKFERGRMIALRPGQDALIIATGGILAQALEAAERWSTQGKEAAVWSAPWLRPFDYDAIGRAATDFPAILTVEEGVETGGLGAATARILAQTPNPRALHIGVSISPELRPASLSQEAHRAREGMDATGILARLQRLRLPSADDS
jgi:transketolase